MKFWMLAALVAAAAPSGAATINFDTVTGASLPGGRVSVTTYAQDGYTLSKQSGTILRGTDAANGSYDLLFSPTSSIGSSAAIFQIFRADGGLFTLDSFVASGLGSIAISGTLNNPPAGQSPSVFAKTIQITSTDFTAYNPAVLGAVDHVFFTVYPGTTTSLGLDDIIVNAPAAAVPELATWGMMMAGLGAIGWSLRRRARRVGARSGAGIGQTVSGAI
ncbi:PEP-CTERM sorting domain-containing protein [Sphingomonas bacterium]|uniref:PEP-CTERM sorting domain-containing protein n=1 Tax=Sphingomonas bacterium TaxID=1895847 RepID=UPI001576EBA3|nr:PEP-CTERM sorting domain-containing protein [Sphingomonas bacterium]